MENVQTNSPEAPAMPTANLVNPPKQTQMVAPQKKGQKSYKVFCLREFQVGKLEWKEGQIIGDTTRIVKPGEIVDVPKDQAKDLCRKIQGSYGFSGERHNADGDTVRHDLTRARLATPADLVEKKPITPIEDDDVLGD